MISILFKIYCIGFWVSLLFEIVHVIRNKMYNYYGWVRLAIAPFLSWGHVYVRIFVRR